MNKIIAAYKDFAKARCQGNDRAMDRTAQLMQVYSIGAVPLVKRLVASVLRGNPRSFPRGWNCKPSKRQRRTPGNIKALNWQKGRTEAVRQAKAREAAKYVIYQPNDYINRGSERIYISKELFEQLNPQLVAENAQRKAEQDEIRRNIRTHCGFVRHDQGRSRLFELFPQPARFEGTKEQFFDLLRNTYHCRTC